MIIDVATLMLRVMEQTRSSHIEIPTKIRSIENYSELGCYLPHSSVLILIKKNLVEKIFV